MSLYDTMAADLALIHADTSGPAVAQQYTPDGGAAVEFRAPFIRTGRDEENFQDGVYEVETAQTVALVSLVPTVTLLKDKIVVTQLDGSGTETWYVRRIFSENAAARELQVMRQVRKRISPEGAETDRSKGAAARRTV